MVKDKKGQELKAGDEIIVRGTIASIPVDFQVEGRGILQLKWPEGASLIGFVESQVVVKAPTEE